MDHMVQSERVYHKQNYDCWHRVSAACARSSLQEPMTAGFIYRRITGHEHT